MTTVILLESQFGMPHPHRLMPCLGSFTCWACLCVYVHLLTVQADRFEVQMKRLLADKTNSIKEMESRLSQVSQAC